MSFEALTNPDLLELWDTETENDVRDLILAEFKKIHASYIYNLNKGFRDKTPQDLNTMSVLNDKIITSLKVEVVCVIASNFKPSRLSDEIKNLISKK